MDIEKKFNIRKSVHVSLLPDTHAEFRIVSIKHGVSMQDIFEEFATLVISGDRECNRVIEDLVEKKRNKLIQKLSATDASSIFDAIQLDDEVREHKDARKKEKDAAEYLELSAEEE